MIQIGHIGSYSGLLGNVFRGANTMAQVWAASVNARGGLDGHPVEITVADDQEDPSRNNALARQMVEEHGVVAFVGNLTPLTATGSSRYLIENSIPVLGTEGSHSVYTESPVHYPQGGLTFALYSAPILGAMADGAGPRIGIIYCAEADTCLQGRNYLVDGGAEAIGGEVVWDAQSSFSQPNFTAECVAASDQDLDILVLALDETGSDRIIRDCEGQAGLADTVYTMSAMGLSGAAKDNPRFDGLYSASTIYPWFLQGRPAGEMHDAIEEYAPQLVPSLPIAAVWAGGKLLERVASEGLSDAPTSEEIVSIANGIADDDLYGWSPGPLDFTRAPDAQAPDCGFPIRLMGGTWTAVGEGSACL